jgi:phosphohistidine phosphatase SixA
VQLVVHQRDEFSQCLLIPHAPGLEQLGYLMRGNIRQTNLSIKGTGS